MLTFLLQGPGWVAALSALNLLMVVGIPLLMVMLLIMRIFMRSKFHPRWQAGLWAFWLINLISLSLIGVTTAKEFQFQKQVKVSEQSFDIPSDTLIVEMQNSPFNNSWFHLSDELMVSDDHLLARSIRVIFEKSPSGRLRIIQQNEARGRGLASATRLASETDYQWQLNGNRLLLPSHFIIPSHSKWRAQEIFLHILIPEGMYVKRNSRLSGRISFVQTDKAHKFPLTWDNHEIWRMAPDGMIAPDYSANHNKDFNFKGFSKIRLNGNIRLTIRQGQHFNVMVKDPGPGDEMKIDRTGDRLNIIMPDDLHQTRSVIITMPRLDELWVLHSDNIEINDFELERLHLVNEGRGKINVFADIQQLHVHLTGGNKLELRGQGTNLQATLSEGAKLDAEHFTVNKANMELFSSSWAKVSAADTLWQKVSDSELLLMNSPVVVDK